MTVKKRVENESFNVTCSVMLWRVDNFSTNPVILRLDGGTLGCVQGGRGGTHKRGGDEHHTYHTQKTPHCG